MNSLIYLKTDDFAIDKNQKGEFILCAKLKGITFIMFNANKGACEYCDIMTPLFSNLPQVINGARFCILNVNQNRQVIDMAKNTIVPILAVPYIVMYVNGRPILQYDDDTTSFAKLSEFVSYAMNLVKTKKNFIDKGGKVESEIPKFTVAMPYNLVCDADKGTCYLRPIEAYDKKDASVNSNTGGRMQGANNSGYQQTHGQQHPYHQQELGYQQQINNMGGNNGNLSGMGGIGGMNEHNPSGIGMYQNQNNQRQPVSL